MSDQQSDSSLSIWQRLWSLTKATLRRAENLVFAVALLFTFLYFLLQMPFAQNWLAAKATAWLSEKTGTKVAIEHVDIGFFDYVILDGLYIEDLKGNPLIYVKKFTAFTKSNFFTAIYARLEFDEIALSNVQINMQRGVGEYDSNLHAWLSKLRTKSKEPKSNTAPFSVKIQRLRLNDIQFLQDDKVKGQKIYFNIPKGQIQVDNIDIGSDIVDIRNIDLDGLVFNYEEFPSNKLPKIQQDSSVSDFLAKVRIPMRFNIDKFSLVNTQFNLNMFHRSPAKTTPATVMDFNHLVVTDINIQAEDIKFTDDLNFEGVLKNLSAKEASGLAVLHSEASKIIVNDTITALYQFKIQTSGTNLGGEVIMNYNRYKDYYDFENKISLDLNLSDASHILIGDILHFDRNLSENIFLKNNKDQAAVISGHLKGKIGKRLKGEGLYIKLSENTYANCNFRAENLGGKLDERIIEFKFEKLQSDLTTISRIIPGFKPPKQFYALGNISFVGDYQIFYGFSHIVHGDLNSDIGKGVIDMNLNLKDGKEKASYSGYLDMTRFDLAAWTGNRQDFGDMAFKVNIAEGSTGLTFSTMKTKVEGAIDHFYYKGYDYKNLKMNGVFSEFVFDGKLGINDPNVVFNFDGNVNMKDSIPQFLFKADLKRLDVNALNLLDEDWNIIGQVEQMRLSGSSWQNLNGTAMLRNFKIIEIGEQRNFTHIIDSLRFTSSYQADGSNYFSIRSDIMDAELKGRFDLRKVGNHLRDLFAYYHPEISKKLGMPTVDSLSINDNYVIDLHIKDLQDLPQLFSNIDTLFEIRANAKVNGENGETLLNLYVPEIRSGAIKAEKVKLNWIGRGNSAQFVVDVPISSVKGRDLAPINFQGLLNKDDLSFNFSAEGKDTSSFVKAVNLSGILSIVDSLWQVKFDASNLALFNDEWVISDDNYIRFSKGYFATNNFEFFNENRRIVIDSFNNGRGLSVALANFDLDFINPIIKRKSVKLRGKLFDFDVKIQDVFTAKGISTFIATDTVFVNGIPYGDINGNIEADSLTGPVWWKILLNYENQQLRLAGAYRPNGSDTKLVEEVDLIVKGGEIQNKVSIRKFPMEILQTFIPGISNTTGKLDGEIMVGGPVNRVGVNGEVWVTGSTKINYLNTTCYIDSQRVVLTDYSIWADGATIWDASPRRLHSAKIKGGIRHDHFSKWELACSIKSNDDSFMMLNTSKLNNELYYGQGIGAFDAQFTGSFVRTNIRIDATTGKESRLYIPLTSASEVNEINFIKFKRKINLDSLKNEQKNVKSELKGLNLEMNLSVTEEAEVQLIFDEQAGDLIKSRGEGDIKLSINREGEFKMDGGYVIKKGEYNFTLLNIVNKPFNVKDGGTIKWFGDPYNALIDLDATYEDNTSLYNLIKDELLVTGADQTLISDASKGTLVVVTMHLDGDLMKPNITFDLDFPNVSPQLKTLADSRLRLIRQDQNELSRQVFGLIVIGQFLPSSGAFAQTQDYTASAVNTLSQVLSGQLSGYLTGLASELFGKSVSSIDFDIAYNEYQNDVISGQPSNLQGGRELQVRLSSGFANDRVLVNVGSQFGLNKFGTTQEGFLGEDVAIEFVLTENRRWRLKVYQRREPDPTGGGTRSRIGGGISFRRDYESFDDLISGVKNQFKK